MTKDKKQNWFDGIDKENVEKGMAILPNFDLPIVKGEPMEFKILDEPYIVETPNSPYNDTMVKMKVSYRENIGEIIVPNSLKHSIAVSLAQLGKDFETANLTDYVMTVKQTKGNDGYNYYNCILRVG